MGPIALEEYELMKDSKYRVYVNAVDKALKNFEYSSEWADLIAALGKLNKVIVSNTKFPVIPRRIKISKRLAQCMHPALPFGVHLKALETYDLIFKSMGTNRLSHELFIYSAGLFPLLGHAAMKVRPALLTVYETHFVPLGHRLRPALSGFLSGVLPGLEEGSDHYVRTNSLLEKVCEGVGPVHFYGCLWDCLASNSCVRLPAITFLLAHFNRKLPTEDQSHIMGSNIETMVCGLMACVQDSSVLVQRCALDLFLLGFPMHNSHLTTDDMIRLVTASLSTILRRDMSLNRRLYAWLLGSEVNMTVLSHHPLLRKAKANSKSTSYFEVFSKEMLVKAIKIILDNAIGLTPHDLKPYKVLVSLLDKHEIGDVIVDDILFEIFRLLFLCYNTDSKSSNAVELLKCANLLFGSLEPRYLWQYIGKLFNTACSKNSSASIDLENPVKRVSSGDPGIVEICTLTEFLLDIVSLETYTDTPSEHLPALFLQIVTLLSNHCDTLTSVQISKGLQLCAKILTRVQPIIIRPQSSSQFESSEDPSDSSMVTSIQQDSTSSDYNQNTDSSSIDEKLELPSDETTFEKSDSLLEQCLRQYERFYVTFTYGTRLKVGETKSISTLLEALKIRVPNSEETLKQLDTLLVSIISKNPSNDTKSTVAFIDGLCAKGKEWVEPMSVASRLLVDLSTLQTFFQSPNSRNVLDSECCGKDSSGAEFLPEWLRVLIVCACWLNSSVPLQLVAITTLLDLVVLCTTAQSLVSTSSLSDEGVTTPLLIIPLLTPAHLKYMEKHTFIFQVIAHWLWTQLGDGEYQVRCVELLHQLHSALSNSDIVESCIGHYLKGQAGNQIDRLESFRRFSSLWHIGREVNAKMGNSLRISDIFYKSMLKMLDNLKLPESDCLKMEAQEWLLHSLMRGDVHRILDPILYILLDPSTARLSVLHIRIKHEDAKPIENTASKEELKNVCAISSVDGTVIYHIDQKKEIIARKKDKQVTAVTAITGQVTDLNQKYVTEKHNDEEHVEDAHQNTEKEMHQNISLYINPFTSESTEINTDFDEYFEEVDSLVLDKSQKDDTFESKGVLRNRSFPALQKELNKKSFAINEALKISSVDLLNLSDTLFTKVSEGESLSTRLNRGSFSSDGLSTIPCLDNSELVRSWSFPGKDLDSSDLEESTVAEEYFNAGKEDTMTVVEDILSDLLDRVAILSGDTELIKPPLKPKPQFRKLHYQSTITSHGNNIDHLHSHLLLYRNKYDSDKVLYAMETLRNILLSNPRAFICASSTTGLVSRSTILKLVARHRKSLFGRGFAGDLEGTNIRSAMYLEVIIITCLYFIRSYYPNLENVNITRQDVIGNKEVQISCTEVLTLLCSHLIDIVRESSKSLACYLADLFSRLKLFKVLLHCVLSSVYHPKYNNGHLSYQVLRFNEGFGGSRDRLPRHSETLQKQLIRLLLFLIILEYEVQNHRGEKSVSADIPPETNELKYINGNSIPQQPLFLTIISRALDVQPQSRHTHAHWTALVACSLPYQGAALTKVVTTALKQICHNIEELSHCYSAAGSTGFPADYGITQIEALTVLCHFCLLDTSTAFNQSQLTSGGASSSQIFSNLTHLFMSSPPQTEQSKERNDAQISARKSVLGHLPRVIASVAVLWQALIKRKEREGDNCEVGSPRVVKQQILDFLSPIAVHHATSFLAAMAVVWRERRPTATQQTVIVMPNASEDQRVLVQLLNGIKAMPIDTLVQTLNQVVKQPAMNQEIAVSVEVSALELFVNYTQSVAASSLYDSWNSLLQLLKEAPTLSPPAQFLLLGALSQFIQRCPPFTDRKDQKDLQDITTKLVESCTTIAGACLEQTTWLRRNLAVREEEPAAITPDKEDKYFDDLESTEIESLNLDESVTEGKPKKTHKSKLKRVTKKIRQDAEKLQIRAMHQWFMRAFVNEANLPLEISEKSKSGGSSMAQYSVSSLTVLAQLLAPLLDVAFGSQEKERVVNLLTTLMYNVTPYLKNHTQRNAGSYFACSQLLASLSSYQYTRKAWKKDVMELLFDTTFFQMEIRALKYWCTVIDNLISQENSTFREFMNRVSMPQGNSLNIFSSKEQEYEQRAQLLKRLAFVIYCGENDQYCNNMPEIQERLAESVKLPQLVPSLQAQVFLCFRVLLLRMSPAHIIPLWPTIISEMVQVMMHMELDLSTDYEDFRSHIRALSSMDWSNNGIQPAGSWLHLQLAAANLLFLAVQMPADRLPQFQMYRWAFVGEDGVHSRSTSNTPDFIPHVTRIAYLMDAKYGSLEAVPTPLLPTCDQIRSLQDLHPFFTAMSTSKYTPLSVSQLEHNLELDLLDAMAPR
ncbi:protein DOP1 homolog isoform X1 [Rhodnius prolixus]|uniref:protein DOP1 homolog isoform X1 n=1 Tax=Rhodnius prolixus TaxID=13249 RepID=UPI003D18EAEA